MTQPGKNFENFTLERYVHTHMALRAEVSLLCGFIKHLQSHSGGLSFAWLVYLWGVAEENSNYHEVHVRV